MRRPRVRVPTSVAPAFVIVLAAALVAAPVSAVEVLDTSGNPGTYSIKDTLAKPGVTCQFEDHVAQIDEQLDRVRARSLKVRGHKPFLTWVGYRFRVYQRAALETDYELVFKGALTKRRASTTDSSSLPGAIVEPTRRTGGLGLPRHPRPLLVQGRLEVEGEGQGPRRHGGLSTRAPVRGLVPHRQPGDGGECFYNFWT